MSTTPVATSTPRRIVVPDLVGGILLAIVMGGALLVTRGWDHNAAVFPRGVSAGGLLLGLGLVVRSAIGTRKPAEVIDGDAVADDLDYVFYTASGRQWAVTLFWFLGFFVALYVLGLYATAVVFTVVYLKREDGRSWLFAGIYALVLTGVLYLAFAVVLAQPVPAGLLGLA
jgi:predicted membrane-bound spermidine synthase